MNTPFAFPDLQAQAIQTQPISNPTISTPTIFRGLNLKIPLDAHLRLIALQGKASCQQGRKLTKDETLVALIDFCTDRF
jgi:hypothetical protein